MTTATGKRVTPTSNVTYDRTQFPFDTPTPVDEADYCSDCGVGSPARTGLVVTRHTWAGQPLGHLMTRCPEHQAAHERRAS